MIDVINFQPFLALALFLPSIIKQTHIQYCMPIIALSMYYIVSGVGLDVAQLGYFLSVLFATFIGRKMNIVKAYFISMFCYHIMANLSHGNPFTLAALEFDVSTFTATAFYLIIFKIIERSWQTASQEV